MMMLTCGLSAKGISGSLSEQAHSGNKQVLGSHGSGGTPSSGLHVLDWAEQKNPRRINPTTRRVMMKKGTDANSCRRYLSYRPLYLERNGS